jgi:hypothetical protein
LEAFLGSFLQGDPAEADEFELASLQAIPSSSE